MTFLHATRSHPLMLALAVAAVMLGVMLALTVILGIEVTGPGYQIVPDPAGTLPF
jgi:hypothetical protein